MMRPNILNQQAKNTILLAWRRRMSLPRATGRRDGFIYTVWPK